MRGIPLLRAVPLHQRRADGWSSVARPRALQPRFALCRLLRDLRERAGHPRQPFVEQRDVGIQRGDLPVNNLINGYRDIRPKWIGTLEAVFIVEKNGGLRSAGASGTMWGTTTM